MPIPPKSRMPLRYRAQYSDRVSVYRDKDFFGDDTETLWSVAPPGNPWSVAYSTHDEAVHEAHRLAGVKVKREVMAAATDPRRGGRWLAIYGNVYDLDASAAAGHPVVAIHAQPWVRDDRPHGEHPPIAAVRALLQAAWA